MGKARVRWLFKLQPLKTAEEKATAKANGLISDAIDEANEKILQAATQALSNTVGEEETEFFNLGPLKEKWGKRQS